MCQVMLLMCVSLACLTVCQGYKEGVPLGSCSSMFPFGHNVQAETSTAPYTLTVNTTSYSTNNAVEVTLTTLSDLYFEGFFVQARRADCSNPGVGIGSFSTSDFDVKVMKCSGAGGPNNAISHSNSVKRLVKKFTWTNSGGEDVFFQATVVHETETFWTKVTSQYVSDANRQSRPNYTPCDGSSNNVMSSTPRVVTINQSDTTAGNNGISTSTTGNNGISTSTSTSGNTGGNNGFSTTRTGSNDISTTSTSNDDMSTTRTASSVNSTGNTAATIDNAPTTVSINVASPSSAACSTLIALGMVLLCVL